MARPIVAKFGVFRDKVAMHDGQVKHFIRSDVSWGSSSRAEESWPAWPASCAVPSAWGGGGATTPCRSPGEAGQSAAARQTSDSHR